MPEFGNNIVLLGNSRITNVPTTPVAGTDAVNADYVEARFGGLNWKDNVFVAPPGNVNISSPGATLDGQTMTTANPRVLLANQTSGTENGLWDWNGSAVAMTRSFDANDFSELRNAVVVVDQGTNAGVRYRQTVMTGTLGTTALVWQLDSASSPSASTTQSGISRHATQAEVNAGAALTPNVTLTPDTAFSATWRVKQATGDFGDGATTVFTITHNLGTPSPIVQVMRNAGNKARVFPDVDSPTPNTVTLTFASGAAPGVNAMKVIVIGAVA